MLRVGGLARPAAPGTATNHTCRCLQVNLKLFAPEPNRRKTTLLFVIRDKSKTPMQRLSEILMVGNPWLTPRLLCSMQ